MSMNAVEALNCYHGLVRECYIDQKEIKTTAQVL